MINKLTRNSILSYITMGVFCFLQSVFAEGINITVINESGVVYKNVEIVITAVGFEAMYGRIALGEIAADKTPKEFNYKYEYHKIPLTGIDMPSSLSKCNLDLTVVAGPKRASGTILTRTFEKIVQHPKIILENLQAQQFPQEPPMQGIQPPNITITIKNPGHGFEYAIDAEFEPINDVE